MLGECFCEAFHEQVKLIADLNWKKKGYTDFNWNSSKIYSKCKQITQNVLYKGYNSPLIEAFLF